MPRKSVKQVVVHYVDGTVETISTPEGFHRSFRNNKSHETDWRKAWQEHEIRWREQP